MPTTEEVNQTIDEIEKKYFDDKKTFGYFIAIGFKDDKQKPHLEMGSNLTKTGVLTLAKLLVDKAESM